MDYGLPKILTKQDKISWENRIKLSLKPISLPCFSSLSPKKGTKQKKKKKVYAGGGAIVIEYVNE